VNIFAGALIIGAVAVYLSVKKLSWKYWFATGYVAALALAMVVFQSRYDGALGPGPRAGGIANMTENTSSPQPMLRCRPGRTLKRSFANGFVFVAGQTAARSADRSTGRSIKEQTRQCIRNIESILKATLFRCPLS
jgi:hypothetical protein